MSSYENRTTPDLLRLLSEEPHFKGLLEALASLAGPGPDGEVDAKLASRNGIVSARLAGRDFTVVLQLLPPEEAAA